MRVSIQDNNLGITGGVARPEYETSLNGPKRLLHMLTTGDLSIMRTLNWKKSLSSKSTKRWALGLAVACFSAVPGYATVINGDFSAGLSDWTSAGDVSATTEATLADNGQIYSYLLQPVALASGQYRIEFDFENLLSADVTSDPNAFPDSFFASLFFVNDLSTFDLANGVFDDVAPLLDADSSGVLNVAGVLSPSAVGPNWTHFSFDFTNNYNYVIPVFELLDFNFVSADSAVNLDNVSITQPTGVVPEPATLTLMAMGLAGCVATRKRNTKSL